jgi:2,3-bisphosphoglycerate-independent phosphoglycerate mutase
MPESCKKTKKGLVVSSKPVVLIVLDGWGKAPPGYPLEFNAIERANIPVYRSLLETYPHTLIHTSGNAVGLPEGVMGNSEVGHMNIGAGRIVWQEITRIDKALEKDDFRTVSAIYDAILRAKASGSRLHLMGLVSDGAVHSVDRHYFAIMRLAKALEIAPRQLVMHCFTDGRDTPPMVGINHVAAVRDWIRENGVGVIGSVIGRYYAMDRDKRWQRTQLAYDALVSGAGIYFHDAVEAVQHAYDAGETDEFIKPRVIVGDNQEPLGTINDGDQVICFNYRADRVRQMSRALTEPDFAEFPVRKMRVHLVTMTMYQQGLDADVAFPPQFLRKTIGELFSSLGKRQLRIAETEKYPHVSFFFSGGEEKPFEGEDRVLIPSARDVPTYDKKPEMSAPEIADRLVNALKNSNYDLVINNFANADMVGHTGVMEAAIQACEHVDAAIGKVLAQVRAIGGCAIITADHGNAEQLWDFEADSPQTQHTTNPVPLLIMDEELRGASLREGGRLCDVAPTMLQILGIPAPPEMDGTPLLQ